MEGYGIQPCHECKYGAGASASVNSHPSDGGECDDRDDGGSDENGENVDCGSGWSARNGGDKQSTDYVFNGRRTPSHLTPRC